MDASRQASNNVDEYTCGNSFWKAENTSSNWKTLGLQYISEDKASSSKPHSSSISIIIIAIESNHDALDDMAINRLLRHFRPQSDAWIIRAILKPIYFQPDNDETIWKIT